MRTLWLLTACWLCPVHPLLAHDGPAAAHEELPPVAFEFFVATALQNEVRITERDGYRFIESNGIPNHSAGQFPNPGNPNSIQPQRHQYRVTLNPQPARQLTFAGRQPFGVAVNGVPFDPGTAEFWQGDPRGGWNYDALSGRINLGLDRNLAHVQPDGSYHYHGLPAGLMELLQRREMRDGMLLLGWAADGFPIYGPVAYAQADNASSPLRKMRSSYRLKQGTRPAGSPGGAYDGSFNQDWEYVAGTGDLDETNGRSGVTPEYPQGTYYYVITDTFPFISRNFRGTPDASFERQGGGPPGGRGGPGGRGRGGPRGGRGGGGPEGQRGPQDGGGFPGGAGQGGEEFGPPGQFGPGGRRGPPPGRGPM